MIYHKLKRTEIWSSATYFGLVVFKVILGVILCTYDLSEYTIVKSLLLLQLWFFFNQTFYIDFPKDSPHKASLLTIRNTVNFNFYAPLTFYHYSIRQHGTIMGDALTTDLMVFKVILGFPKWPGSSFWEKNLKSRNGLKLSNHLGNHCLFHA